MGESDETVASSISQARTPQEIGDYWDTHSLADHWDQTRDVEFEVAGSRRRRVALDPEIYAQVEAVARERGVLPDQLVQAWLSERLQSLSKVGV